MDQQHIDIDYLRKREINFLDRVTRISWVILFFAIVYQLIFFPDLINIIALAAVVFAWIITTKIWLRKEMLEKHLLSTFMILGFTSTQFYFPLVFTTMENKPMIFNLELPEQVFLHSTAALLVIIVAHALYRFFMRVTPDRSVSLLGKAGFFDPPNHLQLWVMGGIGMASSFYVYFTNPEIGNSMTGDPSGKLLQALIPFTYAPFFIPLSKLYGYNQKPHKGAVLFIVLYAILLFAISMGRNSRGVFIFGLTTPAFAYILGLLLGVFKTRIFTVKNVVVVGFIVWLLTGPLTDLGTAMLNVRGKEKDISASELIINTLEAWEDKEAIKVRRKSDLEEGINFDWDERYLDNLFTARFSNIKFNDLSLISYSKVGEYDPDMQEFSLDQLVSALPDPIIKMFNFDVDKELIISISFGDYLYIISGGYGPPGGYRVGHFAGTGMAAFGWWYLLLFGLVLIPIFYLNDKFFRQKSEIELASEPSGEKFHFSFAGVLALTSFFQSLSYESVVNGAIYLMRGWIQIVILYFLMFHLSRILSLMIIGRKRRQVRFSPN